MAKKRYDWEGGAVLEPHSGAKLRVLEEYFSDYIRTRCEVRRRESFRLTIVDAFAGGGRYRCGTDGSPLIFFKTLRRASEQINLQRASEGLPQIHFDAAFYFNDAEPGAIEALQSNLAPLRAEAQENARYLRTDVEFTTLPFAAAFPALEAKVVARRAPNLLVNLDQYGHGEVFREQIVATFGWANSVEVFFTFAVESLLAFLNKRDPVRLERQLQRLQLSPAELSVLRGQLTNKAWLGAAERLVFDALQECATFVSPFSINNPEGWAYWLMHFARSHRARQVYNNVLHKHAGAQAHFGRSGLEMLAYNPEKEGMLYLFDEPARVSAFESLCDDIPRLVAGAGNEMKVADFYSASYNTTPAHADDIHRAMIESPVIEITTEEGGERRTPHTIKPTDAIRVKRQTYLFSRQQLTGAKKD